MAESLLTQEAAVELAESVNITYGLSWTPETVIQVADRYFDEGVDSSPAEAVDCIAHHEHFILQHADG